MRWIVSGAAALLLLAPTLARACQIDSPFPPPTWEESISHSHVVFVGHVTAIEPNSKPGWEDRVFLTVDTPIRGNLGLTYEAMQGSGGDCGIEFSVGDRVIFAGDFITDPTVFLSDPLTPKQQTLLDYVNKLAQVQAAKGAGK